MDLLRICVRIKWDCLRFRRVLAGAGVFASPVMSVSLADPHVNRRAFERQRPVDNGPGISTGKSSRRWSPRCRDP